MILRFLRWWRRGKPFCPGLACPSYSAVTEGHIRKCYYSPQCWRGGMDVLLNLKEVR